MDFATLLPFAIFGGITCGALALMSLAQRDSRAADRLDELKNPGLRKRKQDRPCGDDRTSRTPAMSKALEPKTELEANELKIRLANAGFNNPKAPQLYLAIKFTALLIGALLGLSFGMLRYGMTQNGFASIALMAGAGFYLPELVVRYLKFKHQQKFSCHSPTRSTYWSSARKPASASMPGCAALRKNSVMHTRKSVRNSISRCCSCRWGGNVVKYSTISGSAPGSMM